jgi:Cu/Ag efflux protein CusF
MKPLMFVLALVVAFAALPVEAQPAKGAQAAFERVREVMSNRFKEMKLAGDPDRDFAAMLIAHHEDAIFLAKTQLEYGGDRQLRQTAQRLLDEHQKEIDTLKQWQVRTREPDYRAQPDQPPPGSGPLDRAPQAAIAQAQPAPPATPSAPAQAPTPAVQNIPMVSGTVEKVDQAAGKITIDHGPIPNLNMDSMTMVFRAQDPAMLKTLKPHDKVRFTADRVNGQITITKIQRAR